MEQKKYPEGIFEQSIKDVTFLEDMASLPSKVLQTKYYPNSERADVAVSGKLGRIRKRLRNARWIVNKVLAIEKRSPYIKKKLISAQAPSEEDFCEED